jgi:glycosyltransferase involved in cell wall biosynthesis
MLNNIQSKIILSPRGMLQQSAIDSKALKKRLFLFLFKLMRLHKRIHYHATKEQEKKEIIKYFGEDTYVTVIPNFIQKVGEYSRCKNKKNGSVKFVFLSLIVFMKNLAFILEQLVGIKGDILFDIYGPISDLEYWAKCEEISQKLDKNISINYRGEVPNHQVPAILKKYHFYVLPTLGENFGHAIYEALSTGIPVIISDRTPWKGLEKEMAGWDIPLKNPEKFREIINKCIEMDDEEFRLWSEGAYRFAMQYAKRNNNIEAYKQLFS